MSTYGSRGLERTRGRLEIMARFGIRTVHPTREIPLTLLDQLERCADDEARRLILGPDGRKQAAAKRQARRLTR